MRGPMPLEATIDNLVDGAYFNAGQSCCAVERIYVHQDIYRKFVDGFIDLTRKYRLGNPLERETTLGPMVRASAAAFVRDQVDEAVSRARAMIDLREFAAAREDTPHGAAGAARRRSPHARDDRGDVRSGRGADAGEG